MLDFVNFVIEKEPLVIKDRNGSFSFRYISVSKDTLNVVSEEGEERSYRLENRFERISIQNLIRSAAVAFCHPKEGI